MLLRRALVVVGVMVVSCESPSGDTDSSGGTTEMAAATSSSGAASTEAPEQPTTAAVTTTSTTEPVGGSSGGEATSTGPVVETTAAGSSSGGPDEPCPRVRVLVPPGETLNVRPTPSTAMAPVGSLASGAIVDVLAIVQGEVIDGDATWYQIQSPVTEGYVFGAWVECTLDEPSKDGFFLPLECGFTATISQGNFGNFSHQGQAAYAFDFSLGVGTPMVAIADGTVSHLYAGTLPGDPCYDGGGQECISEANYVTLLHADGTSSIYFHLSEVDVDLGEAVPRGSVVGLSGSSGWSTGPHAHVARQESCGASCQSIELVFADVAGDGVPDSGEVVTSQNCP